MNYILIIIGAPCAVNVSITATRNPKAAILYCWTFCNGVGFLPGAFSSTNTILAPGSRTNLSGTPALPREMNLYAILVEILL